MSLDFKVFFIESKKGPANGTGPFLTKVVNY
jgi:hypothetical protein